MDIESLRVDSRETDVGRDTFADTSDTVANTADMDDKAIHTTIKNIYTLYFFKNKILN